MDIESPGRREFLLESLSSVLLGAALLPPDELEPGHCQVTLMSPVADPPDHVSICANETSAARRAATLKADGYATTKHIARKIRVAGLIISVWVLIGWKRPSMSPR